MREILDHHGHPIMRAPVVHGYDYDDHDHHHHHNPPAYQIAGHPYTPPPPLYGTPYSNQPNIPQYTPPPPFGTPGFGNVYPHQPPRQADSSQVTLPLPPGFERGQPPVYPKTPNPAAGSNNTSRVDKSSGIDYPSMVEESKVINSTKNKKDDLASKKESPSKLIESSIITDNSKKDKDEGKEQKTDKSDKTETK